MLQRAAKWAKCVNISGNDVCSVTACPSLYIFLGFPHDLNQASRLQLGSIEKNVSEDKVKGYNNAADKNIYLLDNVLSRSDYPLYDQPIYWGYSNSHIMEHYHLEYNFD